MTREDGLCLLRIKWTAHLFVNKFLRRLTVAVRLTLNPVNKVIIIIIIIIMQISTAPYLLTKDISPRCGQKQALKKTTHAIMINIRGKHRSNTSPLSSSEPHMRALAHTHTQSHTHTNRCTHAHTHRHRHRHTHTNLHTHMRTHTHTNKHTHKSGQHNSLLASSSEDSCQCQ